jgi:3-phenylpropionate/cinnamic acid dioxygenase small subunit
MGMADDDSEIRTLLARMAQLADSGDLDTYLGLLLEDAAWVIPAIPQTGVPASERHGREEIGAGVRERRAMGVQGPGSNTMHLVTTIAVDVDGDDASASSTWMFVADTTTSPRIQAVGRYRDTLRRTPVGWRLARREITAG